MEKRKRVREKHDYRVKDSEREREGGRENKREYTQTVSEKEKKSLIEIIVYDVFFRI